MKLNECKKRPVLFQTGRRSANLSILNSLAGLHAFFKGMPLRPELGDVVRPVQQLLRSLAAGEHLLAVFRQLGEEIVQKNTEAVTETSIVAFLFDNPVYLMVVLAAIFLILFFVILSVLSVKSKNKQQRIAAELAAALTSAKEANEVKQNFFSKMSHDIRTPLNVVLRMTQIAQKYKNDSARLERSL